MLHNTLDDFEHVAIVGDPAEFQGQPVEGADALRYLLGDALGSC